MGGGEEGNAGFDGIFFHHSFNRTAREPVFVFGTASIVYEQSFLFIFAGIEILFEPP